MNFTRRFCRLLIQQALSNEARIQKLRGKRTQQNTNGDIHYKENPVYPGHCTSDDEHVCPRQPPSYTGNLSFRRRQAADCQFIRSSPSWQSAHVCASFNGQFRRLDRTQHEYVRRRRDRALHADKSRSTDERDDLLPSRGGPRRASSMTKVADNKLLERWRSAARAGGWFFDLLLPGNVRETFAAAKKMFVRNGWPLATIAGPK
jgi:hypothetical protein